VLFLTSESVGGGAFVCAKTTRLTTVRDRDEAKRNRGVGLVVKRLMTVRDRDEAKRNRGAGLDEKRKRRSTVFYT